MAGADSSSAASSGVDLLELDNQLCFALHSAARQVVRSYRPALDELGLTHPQYLVLLVLWAWASKQEARPTVKALGARLTLDSGTLTPLLKRLEARGLITRVRSDNDERELFVRLTPAGLRLRKQAKRVPAALLRQSPLPVAELIKLRNQLKQLRNALTETHAVQAPSTARAKPSRAPLRPSAPAADRV